jgi:hypothetical protein
MAIKETSQQAKEHTKRLERLFSAYISGMGTFALLFLIIRIAGTSITLKNIYLELTKKKTS